MADQLDNRPVFIIVMGGDGAGKSARKRLHYDILPTVYVDQLELVDNSQEDERGTLHPVEQCVLEKGDAVSNQEQLAHWCRSWLGSVEQAKRSQAFTRSR